MLSACRSHHNEDRGQTTGTLQDGLQQCSFIITTSVAPEWEVQWSENLPSKPKSQHNYHHLVFKNHVYDDRASYDEYGTF